MMGAAKRKKTRQSLVCRESPVARRSIASIVRNMVSSKRKAVANDGSQSVSLIFDLERPQSDSRFTGTSTDILMEYHRLETGSKLPSADDVRPPKRLLDTIFSLENLINSHENVNKYRALWGQKLLTNFKSLRQHFVLQRVGVVSSFPVKTKIDEFNFALFALLCNCDAALLACDVSEFIVTANRIQLLYKDAMLHSPETQQFNHLIFVYIPLFIQLICFQLRNLKHPSNTLPTSLFDLLTNLELQVTSTSTENLINTARKYLHWTGSTTLLPSRLLKLGMDTEVDGRVQWTSSLIHFFSPIFHGSKTVETIAFAESLLQKWMVLICKTHQSTLRLHACQVLIKSSASASAVRLDTLARLLSLSNPFEQPILDIESVQRDIAEEETRELRSKQNRVSKVRRELPAHFFESLGTLSGKGGDRKSTATRKSSSRSKVKSSVTGASADHLLRVQWRLFKERSEIESTTLEYGMESRWQRGLYGGLLTALCNLVGTGVELSLVNRANDMSYSLDHESENLLSLLCNQVGEPGAWALTWKKRQAI